MVRDTWLDPEERDQLAQIAEVAITVLSFLFLALLVAQFALPLSNAQQRWIDLAQWGIWVVFTVEFLVRFAHAERKLPFLRRNWLAAIAVALPAFRVLRVARAVRAARSLRLARIVTGANRGAGALRRFAGFAGAGYFALLALLIWVLSAAGMLALERDQPGASITSFPDALWWSATTIIQQGSEQGPVTSEGRILAVLLMVFALGISGYITAVLAAFLLGRRRDTQPAAGPGTPLSYIPPRATDDDSSPDATATLEAVTPPASR